MASAPRSGGLAWRPADLDHCRPGGPRPHPGRPLVRSLGSRAHWFRGARWRSPRCRRPGRRARCGHPRTGDPPISRTEASAARCVAGPGAPSEAIGGIRHAGCGIPRSDWTTGGRWCYMGYAQPRGNGPRRGVAATSWVVRQGSPPSDPERGPVSRMWGCGARRALPFPPSAVQAGEGQPHACHEVIPQSVLVGPPSDSSPDVHE